MGTVITITPSTSTGGGIVIYPDADAGTNITAPGAPGTSLSFTALTITLAPPSGCVADFDNSGTTDVFDFGLFASAFGSQTGDPGYNAATDLDDSGSIDVFDFGLFAADFGCSS